MRLLQITVNYFTVFVFFLCFFKKDLTNEKSNNYCAEFSGHFSRHIFREDLPMVYPKKRYDKMKSIETTFNKDIIEILHLQKDYNNQKKSLQKELQLGIIDVDSFSEEMTNLSKKEIQLKQKTVFSYHVTSNGTPKVIAQYGPNRRNLWHTKVSKGKIITAKSYEELINKLFTYYTGGLNDYSVHSIFEAALLEKQVSDNPKQGTINKNVNDYKRFINDEFSITDIHEINSLYVKKYTQSLVKSKKLSENAFLAYKGILNLIFGYAISEHIISTNPVDEIKNSVYLKDCYAIR